MISPPLHTALCTLYPFIKRDTMMRFDFGKNVQAQIWRMIGGVLSRTVGSSLKDGPSYDSAELEERIERLKEEIAKTGRKYVEAGSALTDTASLSTQVARIDVEGGGRGLTDRMTDTYRRRDYLFQYYQALYRKQQGKVKKPILFPGHWQTGLAI